MVNAYFHLYTVRQIEEDALQFWVLLQLLVWAATYPPLVFWELNCVLLLHLLYRPLEWYMARRFVMKPTERKGRQLQWVMRHAPSFKPAKLL